MKFLLGILFCAGLMVNLPGWAEAVVPTATPDRHGGLSTPMPARTLPEVVALCRRTYDYVAKSVPAEKLQAVKKELDAELQTAEKQGLSDADKKACETRLRALRRKILFLHPDLQFDKLLCVQRDIPFSEYNHEIDQYLGRYSTPGPGLVVLENWREAPRKTELLKGKLPMGCVFNPDLHWDADRIIFAFCDHTRKAEADPVALKVPPENRQSHFPEMAKVHLRYFIYECAADGSWVRQLTGCPGDPMTTVKDRQTVLIEDADPCYTPDGGFIFTSTRSQSFGRCHWGRYTPSFLLYRAELPPVGVNAAARDIRRFSFGEANEWEPSVMDDGRILYTRWDYVDRDSTWLQSLWTVHPDGTAVAHYYGNYSRTLTTPSEAKSVPGTRLAVCTAGAHHMVTGGSLVLVDPLAGEDGPKPLIRLTPEINLPEAEGWNFPGYFAGPMPVNDTLFFASYTDGPGQPARGMAAWPKPKTTSIWLVDTLGGRELIYRDPMQSTFNPIPLVKRPRPTALTSTLPPRDQAPDTGICYVQNCYEGRVSLPKGSVVALRLNELINQPTALRHTPHPERSAWGEVGQALFKRPLGIVPVAPDGSAAFRIPAGLPIQLQAIDTNGMAVLTMRSFIYSQRGEVQGCLGCHEDKRLSRGAVRLPQGRKIDDPVPELKLDYPGAFSYARSVRPVLDRKCISCHGLDPTKKCPSFIGYDGLVNMRRRGQVVSVPPWRADVARPYDFYAAASPLTKRLRAGHGPQLTADEWKALILWMDLNIPDVSYDTYSWNDPAFRAVDPAGEAALRAEVKKLLGDAIAAQPFDALVNRGDETKSRVLWLCKPQDRARLLALCQKAVQPRTPDVQGTCGRDENCMCHSCWVRRGGYNRPQPPPVRQVVQVKSSLDGTLQPCLFWAPVAAQTTAVPLVVALHTWSADYHQVEQDHTVLNYAQAKGWAMVGPNFRGPNQTPPACGGEPAVQDIVDAIDYAKAHAKIDTARIYIIGGSGGGHMTLLMLGRHPEIFAGGAAFCPITDVARWHADSRLKHPGRNAHYAKMLEGACGGTPAKKPEEYRRRSPLTWLARAKAAGVPVYIVTGIHDGWQGSVPVGHAFRGYNALADEPDRISETDIAAIEATQRVPATLAAGDVNDPFYANRNRIHLRRTSANVRFTLMEGGHGGNYPAGLDFLSRQVKGHPADFTLPAAAQGGEKALGK